MPDMSNQKNKISLSDYNYRRDIENRLLMADLTVFEVDVLREILDGSLKIPIHDLADTLDVNEKKLTPALNKLSKTQLLTIQGDTIFVDKEMRKYYESQIDKFDDHFEPGMEYLQGLLSKVPMHALLSWYSIPRTSNNIFSSIIENYLQTPKIYERYLSALRFDAPVLDEIVRDVLTSSELKVRGQELMERYGLSREQFEEYMLLLEFNFVCCLGYTQVDEVWEEVVTPFHEWSSYVRFLRETKPKSITDVSEIQRSHPEDNGFVQDINRLLKTLEQHNLKLTRSDDSYTLSKDNILFVLPHLKHSHMCSEKYTERLIETATDMQLATVKEYALLPMDEMQDWLLKPIHDQTTSVYRYSMNGLCDTIGCSFGERDLRETERSLQSLVKQGWVYFDDYIKSLTAPIGNAQQVVLQNKGKKWKYALPTYSEEEIAFIKTVLFKGMFEAGLVATGIHHGKSCFCVTPFGRIVIGDERRFL